MLKYLYIIEINMRGIIRGSISTTTNNMFTMRKLILLIILCFILFPNENSGVRASNNHCPKSNICLPNTGRPATNTTKKWSSGGITTKAVLHKCECIPTSITTTSRWRPTTSRWRPTTSRWRPTTKRTGLFDGFGDLIRGVVRQPSDSSDARERLFDQVADIRSKYGLDK